MGHMKALLPDLHPSPSTLRNFGFIAFGVFGALGVAAYTKVLPVFSGLGSACVPVALSLAAVGLVSGAFSVTRPAWNRYLFVALTVVTFPLHLVVSHALLAFLFFLLITPSGIIMRVFRRDPLARRPRAAESYWHAARPARSIADYFRQY